MNADAEPAAWWELHLRQARGEPLSGDEQQRYDAEIARHDQEVPAQRPIEALKVMRAAAAALAHENTELRLRIERLEGEIRTLEQALSRQSRELLGIGE